MAGFLEGLRGGQRPHETTKLEPAATSYGRLTLSDKSLYGPRALRDIDLQTERILFGNEVCDVAGEVASNARGTIIAARIPGSSIRDAYGVRETHVDLLITEPFRQVEPDDGRVSDGIELAEAVKGEVDDVVLSEVAGQYRDRLGLREQDLLVVGDFVTIGVDYPSVVKSEEEVPEDLKVLAIPTWLAEGERSPLQPEDPKQVTVVFSQRFKYKQ